jgi:hypothetical protein
MDFNPLAEYVYEIIQEKGFHDIEHSQIETLTFRQLLHLVTEWGEMFYHYDTMRIADHRRGQEHLAKLYEEGADVLIVALDLAAMHHIDLGDVPIQKPYLGAITDLYASVPLTIGHMGDIYRKQRVLDRDKLVIVIRTICELLRRHGANPLDEVQKKMVKNAGRPTRYGTAEVAG